MGADGWVRVAMTAMKAAFVAKVGSLFGCGKLTELELRNEDFKLLEFTDFAQRYFLYAERLTPIVNKTSK